MYENGESIFYYITLGNENYPMPALPKGEHIVEGILRGLYRFQAAPIQTKGTRIHLLGSGSILREALRAQQTVGREISGGGGCVECDQLQGTAPRALEVERWNRLHPLAERARVISKNCWKRRRAFSLPPATT